MLPGLKNLFNSSKIPSALVPGIENDYSPNSFLAEKIANSILKSVLKYDKHPSVTALRNLSIRSHFEFSFFSVDEVLKEI